MVRLNQNNKNAYQGKNSEWTRTASLATDLGDACYLVESTGKISPASSFPDQGDEGSTQRAFAALFAGIAGNEQPVTDTTSRTALQYTKLEIELACDSATFAMNDYVAPKYTTGVLSDQAFVKVTDPSRAIGKVTKPATSATSVWVLAVSPLFEFQGADTQSSETVTGQPGSVAGEAGASISYQGGEGGDSTTTTGGVGGGATWKSGAGGTATTGAGGAAGAVAITGAAGGATSAGTGNGGAGGSITITPGAGGASFGGAAGARGTTTVTSLITKAGSTAVAITSATTLTQADSGGIFTMAQSSTYDVDLPSPTTGPGLSFFFSLTAPGSFSPTITVAGSAATFVGNITIDAATIVATGSTLTFATGASALGDSIEIRSISTSLYHVRAFSSTSGGITIG